MNPLHLRGSTASATQGMNGTITVSASVSFVRPRVQTHLLEINQCATKGCGANAKCFDFRPPSSAYSCTCNAGFVGTDPNCLRRYTPSSYYDALELDACLTLPCGANARCTDHYPPSVNRTCTCNSGFEGDPYNGCTGVFQHFVCCLTQQSSMTVLTSRVV
jgi:hypothetical protein